jgi:hypothetical protein
MPKAIRLSLYNAWKCLALLNSNIALALNFVFVCHPPISLYKLVRLQMKNENCSFKRQKDWLSQCGLHLPLAGVVIVAE